MANYSYINLRMLASNEVARKQAFERILSQCVERALGAGWRVALTEFDDDGPVWAVDLPGTAKPMDARPIDPPSMYPNEEDVGFPVALQHKRIAFRHGSNHFCGWAQGCVAEELADYYGRGVFFDATSRTQRPKTREYRRGKTFKEYLTRNFQKPLSPDDVEWIESFKRFVPTGHW